MPSPRRIEKLNMLFLEELSKIVDREVEFPEGVLVTFTRVAVSSDGSYADAFLSVLANGKANEVLAVLQKNRYDIERLFVKSVRVRPVPHVRFFVDEGEIRRQGVEHSIAKMKQQKEL